MAALAGYRIHRRLGAGGMGEVYLAEAGSPPQAVALKVLDPTLAADPGYRRRFLREAELAATLPHANIVAVYDHGETADGTLWIVMQYVAGTDADTELRAGRMPPRRAVRIAGEVAVALDYAHRRGLLHGDVKPANFLLTEGDPERVLLADFGLARRLADPAGGTDGDTVLVTAAYAAPEILRGESPGPGADVYSLGCSLFRLLTGKPPFFAAGSKAQTVRAHLHLPPPDPTRYAPWLPPQFDAVIATAMAKDPAARYRTAGDLAEAAASALAGTALAD